MDLKNGISVLMSVYKGTKLSEFKETICSIKNQTLLPNQVVLTIDGPIKKNLAHYISNDLKHYLTGISIYKIPYNSGLANALNQGMKLVKYNLIARVDTDDILVKTRFADQKRLFKAKPFLSIVGGYVNDFHHMPKDMSLVRKTPISYNNIKIFGKSRNPMNHPTIMMKTEVLYKLGGYPNFPLFEDYGLWIKALHFGYLICNIPKVLVYMRVNDNSLSRRGGIAYFLHYLKLEKYFHSINYITYIKLIYNSSLMLINSLIPLRLRSILYKIFLRKRK